MIDPDDKVCIENVLAGNTASFEYLVNKYKEMVYTVCYRILRQHENAEDAAQMAFIKAYKNLHAFKSNSKFSTWLYTIAYRTTISRIRTKRAEDVNDEFIVDNIEESSFTQLENLENVDQQIYVKRAIEQLSEIDGVIITLYYMDDCNIQEIVEITGLSESNVKIKLHRSRKQLKTTLESLLKDEVNAIRNGR